MAKAREAEDAAAPRGRRARARRRARAPPRRDRGQGSRRARARRARCKAKAEEEERQGRKGRGSHAPCGSSRSAEDRPAPRGDAGDPARRPSSAPRKIDREREARDKAAKAKPGRDGDDGRRSGKLTLNQALTGGEGGRQRSMAAMKRKQERARAEGHGRPSRARKDRARRAVARSDHGLGTCQPHGRTRGRCGQGADEERHHGDPEPDD